MGFQERIREYGLIAPDVLLPKKGCDMSKWAVVACDQYTSEREYWESLKEEIGSSPSTLKIIYPEVYLEAEDKEKRIEDINKEIDKYLSEDLFDEYKESFILVKRDTESGTRYGLMAALDLEKYDYSKDSRTLIRATEGTILSRIPPRKEIRKNAKIEVPHIMVLISDEDRKVIEPLRDKRERLEKIYDVELLKNGGHLTGYLVSSDEDKEMVLCGIKSLYDRLDKENPLLFAMGDGNHSLATAKSCWEDIKKGLTEEERENHKARFALVEIENIFDDGLKFEPIHRVFFSIGKESFESLLGAFATFTVKEAKDRDEMDRLINSEGQHFGLISSDRLYVYTITSSEKAIAAGTIQLVIDKMLDEGLGKVDYIHGENVALKIGNEKGNLGIILPDIHKEDFFSDMLKDGAYPRKTFSIGHANEKRYYMEARRIAD